jgi:hypothetical protein
VLHAHLWWLFVCDPADSCPSLIVYLNADVHFATRFLDPALGFALGWLQWYGGIVTLPAEIIGATLIITLWDSGPNGSGLSIPHMAGYITVCQCCSSLLAHTSKIASSIPLYHCQFPRRQVVRRI